MGSLTDRGPVRSRRAVGIAVAATAFAVVLVVGLAFANSISVGRAADNARALHWANSTLGTSALARSAVVQAATFTELEETGQVGIEDSTAAMEDAVAAHQRLAALLEPGVDSASVEELAGFQTRVGEVIEVLESGNYETAKDLIVFDLETAYIDLTDSLQVELDVAQAAIAAHEAAGARFADFVRFFLSLAIPAAAILTYRFIARRQVAEHRVQADLEVEAEREVSRAKDAFIAGISHELRTPLTSIYGFAEVLTGEGHPDPDTIKELSTIIASEAADMTRMVDDLLAAARIESTGVEIEMSPTRLKDVVESAIAPFERAGIVVRRYGPDVVVDTDSARLRHVIINLLSNAARHGGPNIGVEVSAGEDVVDIEVWDDGPGVPEDQVERLFERFVHDGKTPLLTGSVGLGLAVASCLASMLGGRLAYQRYNARTYFTVSLPLPHTKVLVPEEERSSLGSLIKALTA